MTAMVVRWLQFPWVLQTSQR